MSEKNDKIVNFYESESLVSYKQDYYGSFAHITKECTVDGIKYEPGLYFGGTDGWEKLDNGKDFITKEADNLTNYYTKTEIDDVEFALSDAINDINIKIEDFDKMTEDDVVDILNSLD